MKLKNDTTRSINKEISMLDQLFAEGFKPNKEKSQTKKISISNLQ